MKTTININTDILKIISHEAQLHSISRSELIIILMKRVMRDSCKYASPGTPIRYQNKGGPDAWHKFHLTLKGDQYEYFLDLRKVMKMSVSLILAFAVKKYINVIFIEKDGDNYLFHSYNMSLDIIENAIIWKFIWGHPPN